MFPIIINTTNTRLQLSVGLLRRFLSLIPVLARNFLLRWTNNLFTVCPVNALFRFVEKMCDPLFTNPRLFLLRCTTRDSVYLECEAAIKYNMCAVDRGKWEVNRGLFVSRWKWSIFWWCFGRVATWQHYKHMCGIICTTSSLFCASVIQKFKYDV